ncbi:hypothetical protein NDU88_007972 [Pleurodeles waltl]|uniref:Uncharacterized protein n=1 Tax=Pleurodeles waltl TaxID=8319 RepID=A0AAV7QME3_PLEWA|nr:hypothetical protein NDU88_007972 [Pleurodeles waltl]
MRTLSSQLSGETEQARVFGRLLLALDLWMTLCPRWLVSGALLRIFDTGVDGIVTARLCLRLKEAMSRTWHSIYFIFYPFILNWRLIGKEGRKCPLGGNKFNSLHLPNTVHPASINILQNWIYRTKGSEDIPCAQGIPRFQCNDYALLRSSVNASGGCYRYYFL